MPPAGSCFSLHQLQMPAPPGPCLLNPPTACALPGPGSPLSYLPPPLNSVFLAQPSQTTSELTTSGSPSSPALTRSPLFSDLTHSVPSRLQLHFLTQSPLQVCPPILHPTSPLAPPPLSQSFSSSCPLRLLGIPRPSSHSATSCARDPLALHRPGPTGSVSRPPCCPAARGPRRSVPAPPVAAAPAPAAQAAATSLPPPTPVLTPGRLPGLVSVCEPVFGRRPMRGGGGRLRAGGSREQVQTPPPEGARTVPERRTGAGLGISPAHRGFSSHPRLLPSSASLERFLQVEKSSLDVPFVKFS